MADSSVHDRRLTHDPQLWRVIAAASLGVFAIELDFFAVQAALPDMAKDPGLITSTVVAVLGRRTPDQPPALP